MWCKYYDVGIEKEEVSLVYRNKYFKLIQRYWDKEEAVKRAEKEFQKNHHVVLKECGLFSGYIEYTDYQDDWYDVEDDYEDEEE